MEGYKKTEKLKLNKLENNNVVDIEAVQENFEILETEVEKVKDIELTDEKIDCTEEYKKLNVVLKELREADKNNDKAIKALKFDDEHITVNAKRKKLSEVLKSLEDSDSVTDITLQLIMSEIERNHNDFVELNKIVDNSTQRDKAANDKHYEAMAKIKELIG